MSTTDRNIEFSEPVLTDTPAWWGRMDVPGVNVVDDSFTTVGSAFEQFLPWEVRKVQLIDNDTFEPVPVWINKRSDNNAILSGGLSEVYTNVQPRDVSKLMDAALDGVGFRVASTGALVGGRIMFASVRLDDVGEMNVHGQKLYPFLAVVNSFDGSGALKVVNTVIRPECLNTIDAAFGSRRTGKGQGEKIGSLKHTTNVMERVPQLQAAIRSFVIVMDDFQREVANMIETTVSGADAAKVIEAWSPIPEPKRSVVTGKVENNAAITRAENRRQALTEMYDSDDRVAPFAGTKWGLFQLGSTFAANEVGIRRTENGPATIDERKLVTLFEGKQNKADMGLAAQIDRLVPA